MVSYQQAGQILADAFLHYPLMLHAFEGSTELERSQALHQLYTHCAKAAFKYGGVRLDADRQAALIWLPVHHFPLGLFREAKAGMLSLPFRLGIKSTLRLMNHDAVSEGWIAKHAGAKMGYIWCVGVSATVRGKGLSRQIIEQSISDMRKQGLNEFWLKTEDAKNVLIYQKLGFELVHETQVKSSTLKSWVMRYKP